MPDLDLTIERLRALPAAERDAYAAHIDTLLDAGLDGLQKDDEWEAAERAALAPALADVDAGRILDRTDARNRRPLSRSLAPAAVWMRLRWAASDAPDLHPLDGPFASPDFGMQTGANDAACPHRAVCG